MLGFFLKTPYFQLIVALLISYACDDPGYFLFLIVGMLTAALM